MGKEHFEAPWRLTKIIEALEESQFPYNFQEVVQVSPEIINETHSPKLGEVLKLLSETGFSIIPQDDSTDHLTIIRAKK